MKETITIPLAHYEQLHDLIKEIRDAMLSEFPDDVLTPDMIDGSLLYEMQTNIVNRITNGK